MQKEIALEIEALGTKGLDTNSAEKKYDIKSLLGPYSGLQIVSLVYAAFKKVAPDADIGFDLSAEYLAALKLYADSRIEDERSCTLEVPPEAAEFVARAGADPALGARPIEREVDKRIAAPLSVFVLSKDPPPGSRITAELKDGEIRFSAEHSRSAPALPICRRQR